MTTLLTRAAAIVGFLWRTDRPLTATGVVMLPLLAAFLIGVAIDPRVVTGAPVWMKPAKFAASIAIYAFTLAWTFSFLREWRRVRAVVGWTSAIVFIVEMAIIAAQAARGTTSHFNVSTPLDGILFTIMGAGIALQTLISAAAAVALWRTRFEDGALGWALRLGLTIAIVGASTGGLMTRPTSEQLAGMRGSAPVTVVGAHTVGAPDGGPGIPGTGWSVEHGDIRVAHFVGLHAFQAVPIVAFLLRRRIADALTRTRATLVASASYAGLFVILLWQALRGQSIVRPDESTIQALTAWAVLTTVALLWAVMRRSFRTSSAAVHL